MHLYSTQAGRAYKICVGVVVWRSDDCVGKAQGSLAGRKEGKQDCLQGYSFKVSSGKPLSMALMKYEDRDT